MRPSFITVDDSYPRINSFVFSPKTQSNIQIYKTFFEFIYATHSYCVLAAKRYSFLPWRKDLLIGLHHGFRPTMIEECTTSLLVASSSPACFASSFSNMPHCIECGTRLDGLINADTLTVNRCASCGSVCDMYYEFQPVQMCVDVALLQRQAWMHVIFNRRWSMRLGIGAIFLCALLEAYTVRTLLVLRSTLPTTEGMASQEVADRVTSIQVVKVMLSPLVSTMDYRRTLFPLMLHSCVEFVLLMAASVWLGNHLRHTGTKYEEVVSRGVRLVSLASAVKLSYFLFLIWKIPLLLLSVVDLAFLIWLVRGLYCVTPEHPILSAVVGATLCVLARSAYRGYTSWNDHVLWYADI